MTTRVTDVLVVGSGGAGLYAAVRAAEQGAKVILVEKGLVGRHGATVGAAGLTAVGPWRVTGDDQEAHFRDTLASGQFINNRRLVRVLVENAPNRVREMEDWGLTLDRRSDGSYFLDQVSGHKYPRLLGRSDSTGVGLTKVLRRRASLLEVDSREDTFVTSLLTLGDRVTGLTAVDSRSGEFLVLGGKAVVLATGGIGQLYPVTSNPAGATGDGLSLALRAGVELVDMEQFQFFPAGAVHPDSLRGVCVGLVEYSSLWNSQGERFMTRYAPETMEKSTRDQLARAIYSEIRADRGTEHGGVYLDVRGLSEDVFGNFRHEYELCSERGLDLRETRAEVAPTAHYFMGGVRINETCETNLAGLYAAGEVTGGVMGANRLSGNSLADITVFGSIAGEAAARYANQAQHMRVDGGQVDTELRRIRDLASRGRREKRPLHAKKAIRQVMSEKVGVIRSEESLTAALQSLRALESDLAEIGIEDRALRCNRQLFDYLEAQNMLLVGQAVAESALLRQESRGAHYRQDYPRENDVNWLRNVITKLEEGSIRTYIQPVVLE